MSEPTGRGVESSKRDSKTRHADRKKGYVKKGFKKNGGGGRYTYGLPGDELTTVEYPDPKDPIREPDLSQTDECERPQSNPKSINDIKAYKRAIRPLLEEYFVSGDIEELRQDVEAMDAPYFGFELVKRAVILSIDRTDRERDLTSHMIAEFYSVLLSSLQIRSAFEALFERCEDLKLDCPNAEQLIASFLARAVMDEVLPPSFIIERIESGIPVGAGIVQQAVVLLSVKRSGSMLEHVWSIGADAPLDELKQSISILVQEYLSSLDLVEAGSCVKGLSVPHFHHEVVKRACVIAMDKGAVDAESLSALLCYLYYQEIVSAKQIFMGFQRVEAGLDDLVLDIPKAGTLFASIVTRAVLDGIITEYQADQLLLE